MENTMEVPQKTKKRITIWSTIPFLVIYPEKNHNSKRYLYPYFNSSSIHKSQNMETTSMSIDRWIEREEMVHVCSGMILSQKKTEIMLFEATWMYYTKWSKWERERQIPNDITYMWNLRYGTNKSTNETEIDSRT